MMSKYVYSMIASGFIRYISHYVYVGIAELDLQTLGSYNSQQNIIDIGRPYIKKNFPLVTFSDDSQDAILEFIGKNKSCSLSRAIIFTISHEFGHARIHHYNLRTALSQVEVSSIQDTNKKEEEYKKIKEEEELAWDYGQIILKFFLIKSDIHVDDNFWLYFERFRNECLKSYELNMKKI